MAPQIARFKNAATEIKSGNYRDLLLHLISPENRVAATEWISGK
jgi:hypothetical protein